jgi:UDPglucose 6-dehydrogenase
MKVTIYGTGYVGLVTGACLAELGHSVLCIDIDKEKIAQLKQGIIPIYEPNLAVLIEKNCIADRLHFATDVKQGVEHGLLQFICVNTPSDSHGAADTSNIFIVARSIAMYMPDYRLIINKSTAPVGTAAEIQHTVQEVLAKHNKTHDFDVAANPEFLKEGSAVSDFLHPDRVIIGTANERSRHYLEELYALFQTQQKILAMDIISAEFTKYAANAMLATKISFINEMANIADQMGADIEQVRQGMALDVRIGPHFIAPGCGYGGSCFPKDVKALIHSARAQGVSAKLLTAVEQVNVAQKQVLFEKILLHFQGQLKGRKFAVWGLAFKPNTDDIREASSRTLLENLWQAGASVQAYDPVAMPAIAKLYGSRADFVLCQTAEACLDNTDALIIVTEWPQFAAIDLAMIKSLLLKPVIFDGRNIFALNNLKELGFTYYGIGRRVIN